LVGTVAGRTRRVALGTSVIIVPYRRPLVLAKLVAGLDVLSPGASYTTVNLRRSKGYEGFASSKDGKFLYGLLEGPLWDAEKKDFEKIDGKEASRILEFDVAAEKFTGRYWHYTFEQNGHAIGDFNMIDATSGLIIERDNGEGTSDKACPAGQRGENCFADLAKFKRVYKVELSDANVGKPVRKIAYIDLMKIRDPDKKARKPLNDGVLTFPFFTIENVDRVDETHIIVGNDNNLPFSSSRDPNKADDNEFVLLEVGEGEVSSVASPASTPSSPGLTGRSSTQRRLSCVHFGAAEYWMPRLRGA